MLCIWKLDFESFASPSQICKHFQSYFLLHTTYTYVLCLEKMRFRFLSIPVVFFPVLHPTLKFPYAQHCLCATFKAIRL